MLFNHCKPYLLALALCAGLSLTGCYSEEALTPTPIEDELLFTYPQGSDTWDREIQTLQEKFGTYITYREITQGILNRAWVNQDAMRVLVGYQIPDEQMPAYMDFITQQFLDFVDVRYAHYLPRYIFLLDGLHFEGPDISRVTYQFGKFDGVDFWAVSFNEKQFDAQENLKLTVKEERTRRCLLNYNLIYKAIDGGEIEAPVGFTTGIDYNTEIQYLRPAASDYYLTRGFVDSVDPGFSEGETNRFSVGVMRAKNADLLAYVRKILYSTPSEFEAQYADYDLVLKRRQLVVDHFLDLGWDLNAISNGPSSVAP